MGKKRLIIVLGLAAAVLGVVLFLSFPSPEPVYQGKTLGMWLDQYGTNQWSGQHQLKQEADAALHHFDTNLIPCYLKMLSAHPLPLQTNILGRISPAWLARLHLPTLNQYETDLDLRRARGSYGLIALGPDAKPAVPELIARLESSHRRVRFYAAFAIRCLGPVASNAVPSMIKRVGDPDSAIRYEALMALGTIHAEAEHTVPLLLDVMKENSANHIVRGLVVESLDQFDAGAAAAVPDFCEALKDPDVTVRLVSLRALGRIHAQPDIAVPALIANLSREHRASLNNFYFTVIALSQYGPEAREAVPAILSCTREDDPQVRSFVLNNLKRIDPDAAARAESK